MGRTTGFDVGTPSTLSSHPLTITPSQQTAWQRITSFFTGSGGRSVGGRGTTLDGTPVTGSGPDADNNAADEITALDTSGLKPATTNAGTDAPGTTLSTTVTTDASGAGVTTGRNISRNTGESDASYQARCDAEARRLFGKPTGTSSITTKVMIAGGIAIGIYVAVLVARDDATNSTVHIKKITIENFSPAVANYRKVTVKFDRAHVYSRSAPAGSGPRLDQDAFNPVIGDVISFLDVAPMEDVAKEYKVIESGAETITLKILNTDLAGFKNSVKFRSPTPSPLYDDTDTSSTYQYTYTAGQDGDTPDMIEVYTSFTNQVANDVADTFVTVINAAAGAAGAILSAAGGAAKQGFCLTVPILCDSTIWILIGMCMLALVAFIILT